MFSVLLGIFYMVLGLFWLRRDPFVLGTGWSKSQVSAVFMAKCLVALLYGYVGGPLYDYRFDTWVVYRESLAETTLLLNDPVRFFTSLFYSSPDEVFFSLRSGISFMTNFQFNFQFKVMAVFNLLSGSNYYVNTLFYSFFTFYGIVLFVKLVHHYTKVSSRTWLIALAMLPGFVFWGSGMYKEGVLFLGVCAALYGLIRWKEGARFRWLFALGLLIVAATRLFTAMMLLPMLLFYVLWGRRPYFVPALLAVFCLLLGAIHLLHVFDLPADIAGRRDEFLLLKGNSLLDPSRLPPTWAGVLSYIPGGLVNALLKPFPWEIAGKVFYLPSALEALVLEGLALTWIWKKGWRQPLPPVFGLLAVFALLNFIIIGISVPFLGAIVRYRSIYLPFIVVPALLMLRGNTRH